MAESKYPEISISELSRLLGADRRTITKRLQPLGDTPTLEEIIGALISSDSIEEARRRKALAEAELKEIQLQEERGEVVRRDDALGALVVLLKWLRNELGFVLPGAVAGQCVGKSEREIVAILQRETGRVFSDCRERVPDIFTSDTDDVSAA